jgi:hypothetical protein
VTPNAASKIYHGADPSLTGSLVGFLAADNVTATYSRTAGEAVGTYTISATLAPLAVLGNYDITYNTAKFDILYRWDGFLQPINDTAHDVVVMSKFKAGQTIPAKFDLKDANGVIVAQSVNPTFNYALIGGACAATETDTLDLQYPPSSLPIYTLTGGHYQYNWSTKGLPMGLYRVFAKLNDGTTQSVDICLAK